LADSLRAARRGSVKPVRDRIASTTALEAISHEEVRAQAAQVAEGERAFGIAKHEGRRSTDLELATGETTGRSRRRFPEMPDHMDRGTRRRMLRGDMTGKS